MYFTIFMKYKFMKYKISEYAKIKKVQYRTFTTIITSFCARLYGIRRTKRKTEQLIRELEKD